MEFCWFEDELHVILMIMNNQHIHEFVFLICNDEIENSYYYFDIIKWLNKLSCSRRSCRAVGQAVVQSDKLLYKRTSCRTVGQAVVQTDKLSYSRTSCCTNGQAVVQSDKLSCS